MDSRSASLVTISGKKKDLGFEDKQKEIMFIDCAFVLSFSPKIVLRDQNVNEMKRFFFVCFQFFPKHKQILLSVLEFSEGWLLAVLF